MQINMDISLLSKALKDVIQTCAVRLVVVLVSVRHIDLGRRTLTSHIPFSISDYNDHHLSIATTIADGHPMLACIAGGSYHTAMGSQLIDNVRLKTVSC